MVNLWYPVIPVFGFMVSYPFMATPNEAGHVVTLSSVHMAQNKAKAMAITVSFLREVGNDEAGQINSSSLNEL